MKPTSRLKDLLNNERMLVAPGAYDALSAKVICNAGFESVYVTGFGVTASLLGKPDIGFITLEEMTNHIRKMVGIVSVPVIADAESGYGNALNTMRAVQEYEAVGIAGFQIEDQCVPKQHKPDGLPQVVSMEEHVEKIHAAVEARKDEDFCIIGRTDALGRHGINEAIKRGNAYAEAGADLIFVHGAKENNDLKLIVKEIAAPNVVNYSTLREGGISPIPSILELEKIGFKLLIIPGELLFGAAKVFLSVLREIKDKGGLDGLGEYFLKTDEFMSVIEMDKYKRSEERFLI